MKERRKAPLRDGRAVWYHELAVDGGAMTTQPAETLEIPTEILDSARRGAETDLASLRELGRW